MTLTRPLNTESNGSSAWEELHANLHKPSWWKENACSFWPQSLKTLKLQQLFKLTWPHTNTRARNNPTWLPKVMNCFLSVIGKEVEWEAELWKQTFKKSFKIKPPLVGSYAPIALTLDVWSNQLEHTSMKPERLTSDNSVACSTFMKKAYFICEKVDADFTQPLTHGFVLYAYVRIVRPCVLQEQPYPPIVMMPFLQHLWN